MIINAVHELSMTRDLPHISSVVVLVHVRYFPRCNFLQNKSSFSNKCCGHYVKSATQIQCVFSKESSST